MRRSFKVAGRLLKKQAKNHSSSRVNPGSRDNLGSQSYRSSLSSLVFSVFASDSRTVTHNCGP
ncbi:hypothetical protein J6590_005045 [Homalodisca vitripennis]|nr:hypothetical protein J6590_005045 [Homalodisca vitripennis]